MLTDGQCLTRRQFEPTEGARTFPVRMAAVSSTYHPLDMAEEWDFYEGVDVRRYGSLQNEDELTDSICDEFFKTHRDGEVRSSSSLIKSKEVEKTKEEGDTSSGNTISESRTEYDRTQRQEASDSQISERKSQTDTESSQTPVQDENRPESALVTKPADENIEDLSRLAMFGNQRKVLRRSQIKAQPQPEEASSTSSTSKSQSGQRSTPSRGTSGTGSSATSSGTEGTDTTSSAISQLTSAMMEKQAARPKAYGKREPVKTGPVRVNAPAAVTSSATSGVSQTSSVASIASTVRQIPTPKIGPVTRARSKEMLSKEEKAKAAPVVEKPKTDFVAAVERGMRNMRVGSERVGRDRAPRANTSSAAASSGSRNSRPEVGRGSSRGAPASNSARNQYLRGDAIPSEGEFRQDLLKRVSSLGPNHRGSSSTPTDEAARAVNKGNNDPPSSAARRQLIVGRSSSAIRPPQDYSRARTVARSASATRPLSLQSNGPHPTARSASTTRPGPPSDARPPSVSRPIVRTASTARPPSVTRPRAESITRPRAESITRPRADSVTRPRADSVTRPRPPSVTRAPLVRRPIIPHTSTSTASLAARDSATSVASTNARLGRGPVRVTANARNVPVKATPSISSARRSNAAPIQPRTSTIRTATAPKGPGDGTPLRGFRSELRHYPPPSGLTPLHRPNTVTTQFHFRDRLGSGCGAHNAAKGSLTSVASSPKPLTPRKINEMVNRLAVPKYVTPQKVSHQTTHGLSCVKVRSRSSSALRRPSSAQSNSDVQPAPVARALQMPETSNRRPPVETSTRPPVKLREEAEEAAATDVME
ncbi:hypothetical protein Q1695_004412 [Nippostrongylus brasiliensis]|nr:hypothetical protein Q1695_004412 [Nippostrongylus brasiliensis]